MEHATFILILAGVFGLFMAWGIGANDVANAMATSVGSRALTIKSAIIIAAIFEFAGAYLAGGEVTSTIRKGIVDSAMFADSPELLVYGMLSALLAAGVWLLFATRLGLPVSTTHSIVGAIVGFAAVTMGIDAVQWGKVGTIAMSWVVSPVLAGTMSYFLYRSVQFLILDSENPFENSKRYVPFYIFLTGFIISLVTVFKGLKHIGLDMTKAECYGIAIVIGVISAVIGVFMTRRIKKQPVIFGGFHLHSVE
ncbi:MAG: inorganic phosphate transporter, partial [Gammaproteobacteria bacterium]